MKKFNESIKIEVSVDMIAQQLLSTIKDDEKHRELITEAIISSALNKNNLSYIYNALNGFTDEINFKLGDIVEYSYNFKASENEDSSYHKVHAKVIDIDVYREAKVKIKFNYNSYEYCSQQERTFEDWVYHTKCNKIPILTTHEDIFHNDE